ncbi:Uma2 family endonuclease [Actinomycetospora atypica]|uniref:Uma2 family endonuclease n=1 Tax=Actinomycetospora atypica TaxID=1290095 RepID=A0ABV9YXX6_9PSEU
MIDEPPRSALVATVRAALAEQAPDDLVVVTGAAVRFPDGLSRTPDVLVARGGSRPWYPPDDVLLAVEVEPTTEDRSTTPAIYGEHGVPSVWRVTPQPPTIRVFALRDGAHHQVAASAHVLAHAPFPLEVALPART